jgi:hypothetical protein
VTVPSVGSSSRSIARAAVDFPQPDSPISAIVSPAASSKLMPSTARTRPTSRWRSPFVIG